MPRRPAPRVEVKLTPNGTVSWPAALRHRWDAEYLMVEDHGGYAVVRPMAEDDPYAITRQRPARDTPEAKAASAAKKKSAANKRAAKTTATATARKPARGTSARSR